MNSFQYDIDEELFHEAWIQNNKVYLCNQYSDLYTQEFQTREQLEEFIANLQRLADEAWPKNEKTENS